MKISQTNSTKTKIFNLQLHTATSNVPSWLTVCPIKCLASSEKCPLQFLKANCDVFESLVLSDQQSKTQWYSDLYHFSQRKPENINIWKATTSLIIAIYMQKNALNLRIDCQIGFWVKKIKCKRSLYSYISIYCPALKNRL